MIKIYNEHKLIFYVYLKIILESLKDVTLQVLHKIITLTTLVG